MSIDSRLFMEVGFVNSTFQAIDSTPYERWINDSIFDDDHKHMVLQRLIQIKDGDDNNVIKFSKVIADDIEEIRATFEEENVTNGLYYFQKLVIPEEYHTTASGTKVYYDENGKIHIEDYESWIYDPEEDFDEIYENIRKSYPDNCFYFDDYSFTIYDLVECFVLIERERINNYLKNNCFGNCVGDTSNIDTQADILLASILVIKDLMEKGDYFEAQRILNGLNTCGNLCKKYSKNLKGCGCGRS